MTIKTLILAGDGINCEVETARAFELAGASPTIIPVQDFLELKSLDDFDIMAFPGGFSFGDEIRSGKILAELINLHQKENIEKFIADGKPIIGICNGFQILTQLKVFGEITLSKNNHGHFINEWVELSLHEKASKSESFWLKNVDSTFSMPIRHKEGNIQGSLNDCIPLFSYDHDVNGSLDQLAGVLNKQGNVLGLMPHPEAGLEPFLFPNHSERYQLNKQLFENAVSYIRERR